MADDRTRSHWYHNDTCLEKGQFPFSWIELKRQMRLKFAPPHATEALWGGLRQMRRYNFKDVFDFHSGYLRIGRLINFDKSAPCGSHAFSIYKSMMISTEDIILKLLEITLKDGEILTLGNAMGVVENAAVPNKQDPKTANTFSFASTDLFLSSTPLYAYTPHLLAPIQIDFNAIAIRQQGCYCCGKPGHIQRSC
jgi:hypothetical protein